jgi:primosomal protein N' (replication factor Y)
MRREPTPAEALLWRGLRRRGLGSYFRRQHPVGPFIADFASVTARLAVETDSDSHTDAERDARRDRYFGERGWRVIRVSDADVYEDLEAVLDLIWTELHGPVQPE